MEKPQKPLAWLNDPDLKEQVLLRMKAHRVEDSIIQGGYQKHAPELVTQFRGCLLGCTLPRVDLREMTTSVSWHRRVKELYGIPLAVAEVLEDIFENLPAEHCADFAVDSIEAIPVGADLSGIGELYGSHTDVLGCACCTPLPKQLQRKDKFLTALRNAPVPEPTQ